MSYTKLNSWECPYDGPCFARNNDRLYGQYKTCRILTSPPEKDKCPFQKPDRNVTNGIYYADKEKM